MKGQKMQFIHMYKMFLETLNHLRNIVLDLSANDANVVLVKFDSMRFFFHFT